MPRATVYLQAEDDGDAADWRSPYPQLDAKLRYFAVDAGQRVCHERPL